jgi:hypothetical protein
VEEQRRMFEADSFPVFPAATECDAPGLPPRRVFRRQTEGPGEFRYVYCDQDESMVAFRERRDAATYARLTAPDRPLLLARLASERIARFENSPEVLRIHAFLDDPEVIRSMEPADLDSLVNTAVELLWFQETLESTLFLSMHELEGTALRRYYYDLNRQVAQSPFMLDLVEAVYRFNQRLASDPLRTLAWANELPPEVRKRFFSLYYTLGGPMYWPVRWESLRRRYGGEAPGSSPVGAIAGADTQPGEAENEPRSMDFLQIMSDPTRVRLDRSGTRAAGRPSIRDRRLRDGTTRATTERETVSDASEQDRQKVVERRKAGTGGEGRTGEGDGAGPERGRRPLQMIRIRMAPEDGDPDRPRMPEPGPTRPGGTAGAADVQEESASRQEPVLWLPPETFVDALLSAWAPPRSRPAEADRPPPVVRFGVRLRETFLREPDEDNVYEARLTNAVSILAAGGWSRLDAVRDAMGGEWTAVRAVDLGRYAAEYSRNAATVDQEQVRGPNYFTRSSIPIPADLAERVRHSYSRHGTGNFDLEVLPAGPPDPLPEAEEAGDEAEQRARLIRALRLMAAEARDRE